MKNLNLGLTIPAIGTVLLILLVSSMFPEQSQAIANNAMTFVTDWFSWLVQICSLVLVGFLLWLAFSK